MHELACPSCNTPSQYDLKDYLFMCPFCSATFHFDQETGHKEIYSEHFIVPNTIDSRLVKDSVIEWLRRLHHNASQVEKEFSVLDVKGFSVPYWIISLEAHTAWKGLVQRFTKKDMSKNNYLVESGEFRKSYRWCISARENICEKWGMTRLHEPKEHVFVDWDGFPLDSTFSRGRLEDDSRTKGTSAGGEKADITAYDTREYFEFKYANGIPILSIQVDEEEGMRRAKYQVQRYHHELSKVHSDILIDCRTELEIAGIQLVHLPFWEVKYMYRPTNFLRYFQQPKERAVLLEGFASGILTGELAVVRNDKLLVNSVLSGIFSLVMLFLGFMWHPAFFFVALFFIVVAGVSAFVGKPEEKSEIEQRKEDDVLNGAADIPSS